MFIITFAYKLHFSNSSLTKSVIVKEFVTIGVFQTFLDLTAECSIAL